MVKGHSEFLDRSWLCVYNLDLDMLLPTDDYPLELAEHEIGGLHADPADNTVVHGSIIAKRE